MVRRHARSPRGRRCRIAVPHGHYKTTTVTAALRASGPFAVDLMDGATNGGRFRSYVTDTLAPALKAGVILDNLPRHKVSGVRDTIERVGARLFYLPPPLATHQASFGLAPGALRPTVQTSILSSSSSPS